MKQRFDYVWNVGVLLMVLLLLVPIAGFTQNSTVKGTVVDSEGEPVIGATITEKGRKGSGAITNLNGDFSLTLSGTEKKIVVTFIGMRTEEVSVTPGKKVRIVLEDDAQQLDEVEIVAIGYGSARRKDLTGAISSVGENTLKDITTTSAASAITGRIAGVNVVTTQGSPDADVKIRIRGGGSITQSNDPLFIVDGFQVNGIGDIPPTDIESIDVLKDASATAIYGAKGANGVVLITTKSGRVGKMEISLNASVGFNHMYNETEVLSPYEYVFLQRELDPSTNAGFFERYGRWEDMEIYKGRKGTDWQAKLFDRTGVKQNYNLNINGGSKDLVYSLSYTRDKEEYIMKTSEFNRDNLNVKISKKFNNKLRIDFNSRMTRTVIDGTSVSTGGKLRDCVKYPPVGTLKDLTAEDLQGSEYIPENISGLNDPFYNVANEYKKQEKFSNSYNAALIWDIVKGLNFRAEGTYVFDFDRTNQIYLEKTGEANNKAGQPVAYRNYWNGTRWTGRAQLSYNKQIKKHRFDITAGLELSSSEKDNMRINSDYYPIDYTADNVLSMWNNGKAEPTYTTIDEPNRSQSYFGRMGYNLNNRYYANFTLRADGTNVFAPGNKWGVFPAGSVAWRISDEKFMKTAKNWLSDMKLRLSYGVAGNARVRSNWRQTYGAVSDTRYLFYQNETGKSCLQTSTTLRNEDLTWESKYSANVGLDMSLFKNRLKVNVDLYKDVTKNLIMSVQLPANSGYRDQYQNLGQTTNQGLEISLNANLIQRKDAYLDFGFNISFNKNRVDALYGTDNDVMILSAQGTSVGSDNYRVFVGQEVGLMYGYIYDGIYGFDDFTYNKTTQRWDLNEGVVDCSGVLSLSGNYYGPGHIKLKDLNGDGKIDPDSDRKVIGHALPKHTGGFNINAGWKGFDLVAMFNWSYGNDILNLSKVDYITFQSRKYQNMSTLMKMEDRFITIDPVTGMNIYNGRDADPERLQEVNQNKTMWHPIINNNVCTDWVVEDGSFLRLGTLTLGYTLPQRITKKFGMKKLRLYATASNVFCLTGYSGQDPEVNTSSSNMTPGVDKSSYPKNKNYVFGANLTF